jgi:ATP-binding cassette subfamily F protein 3
MSLITISSLSKSFGHRDIFAGVSLAIPRGARFAIVGANGVGKTTLLKIIIGDEEPSSGSVAKAKGVRIGYLPQEADFETDQTLWFECLSVFADLIQQQEELHRLEALMADPKHTDEVIARYGKLQDEFDRKGGYTYTTKIKQVLTGLGFAESDYEMPLDHLSGGQRTRAYLARLLLSNPDLLLLDEPTNHLDINAVEWLEGYLSQWEGAAVIVSHDRYFLDRVATDILEMAPGGTETYRGNYSAYLNQREARWTRRIEVFESEKEKLLKEVEYIKRNISGQNTLQAKGKLKRVSRMIQAIEKYGIDVVLNTDWIVLTNRADWVGTTTTSSLSAEEAERRVRGLQAPKPHMPVLKLNIRAASRSGDLVLRTRDLEVGYADKPLFRSDDLELRRGDCAALIGPNGAGKSTFLKTALEHLEPLSGEVILGASLHIGYFAQAHEGLNPDNTLIQEIQTVAKNMLTSEVRDYLARYLFTQDDAFKLVGMLSGGERGRLALAKMALTDTNFLLLDEPTNHLDILSQEVLQSVLDQYSGTILLVSHDRYLIDALATQIWEIDPAESRLVFFKGTYSQMKEERAKLAEMNVAEELSKVTAPIRANKPAQSTKEERRKKAQLQEVENAIASLESKLADVSCALENPPSDAGEVVKLSKEYESIQKQMDEKLKEWEAIQA